MAYSANQCTYIKNQLEYPGPDSLRPGYNTQNTSADADNLFIIQEWLS